MDQLVPPPPSATDQSDLPPLDISIKQGKQINTLSTKTSTDHLICKTPQESQNGSEVSVKGAPRAVLTPNRILICLGALQFLLGFLMVLFGMYVIAYKASLSHLGGGIWGGFLAMVTGIAGCLAGAERLCPFKNTAQKMAHTTFLALSLISIAVSQLIVVIASTGLARDVNSVEFRETMEKAENMTTFQIITVEITQNYKGILFNAALIIVSALECIVAAVASYRSSRELCPCFRRNEDYYQDNLNVHRSHALVSSWLMEKHGLAASQAPQIYVVAGTPSTLGRGSKMSSHVMPMPLYAIPGPLVHQSSMMGYPLIPAPLGQVPSPIIPPPNRKMMKVTNKYYKSKSRSREPTPKRSTKSRSKSTERQMTEEDVARTYTGLDRVMAEEFINICEMKNASLCSSSDTSTSSCTESSCQSPCHSNSDANSQDCLLNK